VLSKQAELDAGNLELGFLFFVLDHLAGVRLDEWRDVDLAAALSEYPSEFGDSDFIDALLKN